MKRRWIFIGIAALVAAVAANVIEDHMVSAAGEVNAAARPFTENMPNADRIDIEAVHLNGEQIDEVLASKTLQGGETATLLHLWRTQRYDFTSFMMCHEPGYRLRFYQGQTLVTEATICFKCHNIYFFKYAGAQKNILEADFNLHEKEGTPNPLQDYLASLFPKPVRS